MNILPKVQLPSSYGLGLPTLRLLVSCLRIGAASKALQQLLVRQGSGGTALCTRAPAPAGLPGHLRISATSKALQHLLVCKGSGGTGLHRLQASGIFIGFKDLPRSSPSSRISPRSSSSLLWRANKPIIIQITNLCGLCLLGAMTDPQVESWTVS